MYRTYFYDTYIVSVIKINIFIIATVVSSIPAKLFFPILNLSFLILLLKAER